MNKLIILLTALFTSSLFAKPAMNYICNGSETIAGRTNQIIFEVLYSDWVETKGYTNQIVIITDPNSTRSPVLLEELRYLAKSYGCAKLTELKLQEKINGTEAYAFEFDYKCNKDFSLNYNLTAACDKSDSYFSIGTLSL